MYDSPSGRLLWQDPAWALIPQAQLCHENGAPKPPQGPGELGMAWDDELIYNLGRDALASLWVSLAAVGTM